jgi:hypothetical protein
MTISPKSKGALFLGGGQRQDGNFRAREPPTPAPSRATDHTLTGPVGSGQHHTHQGELTTAANRAVGPWAGWQAKQGEAESGAQVTATNDAPPNRGASPDTEPERQTKKDEAHEARFDYGPHLQLENAQTDTLAVVVSGSVSPA